MTETKDDFETWLAQQAEEAHEAIESVHGQARAKLYAESEQKQEASSEHTESSAESA